MLTPNGLNCLRAGLAAVVLFAVAACSSTPDKITWKNKDADQTRAQKEEQEKNEVTPGGLETGHTTPISSEEARRTALSRPRVVSVEEVGKRRTGRKYFDVIEEKSEVTLAPVIDESAQPVRIVTYDNNSVRKDYPMRFGVAWGRVIESVLDLPLNAVDRSSGVIVTDWLEDQAGVKGESLLSLKKLFGSKSRQVRYKYTIRVLDRGNMTQINVIPFVQVMERKRWSPGRPSIAVTESMFDRIDRELSVPLPSERD